MAPLHEEFMCCPKEGVETDPSLNCINACVWMYILKIFNVTYTVLFTDSLWYGVLSWKQLVDSRVNIYKDLIMQYVQKNKRNWKREKQVWAQIASKFGCLCMFSFI